MIKVNPVDAMAVWEFYIENPQMLNFLPDIGIVERRQFAHDAITPLCDKWYEFASEQCGYSQPYDLEFVPRFLMGVHVKNLITDDDFKTLVFDIASE